MSKCLIIVGMHRSGTSYTSGLLQQAGLDVGKNLLGKNESNLRGHFENKDFLKFHKKVLAGQGLHSDGWDMTTIPYLAKYRDEAEKLIKKNDSPYWGWKEPRTTLLLDFWKELLPNAYYLCVYRAPWEVTDSLYRRTTDPIFAKDPSKAAEIWNYYNEVMLKFHFANESRSLLYNVEEIIKNPTAMLEEVNRKFGFNLKLPPGFAHFDEELYNRKTISENFQTGILRHSMPEIMNTYFKLEKIRNRDIGSSQQSGSIMNKEELFRQWYSVSSSAGELSALRKEIGWMKKTKFWKMREAWVSVKKFFGKHE